MPYLGNPPAERFTSLSKQTITGDGGTAYTLDFPVGSNQDVEVFVNNVRQEPGVAYTVSGTSLTMTGAVQSSDDFYVVFQGKAIGTVTHPAGDPLQATSGTFTGNVDVTGAVTADGLTVDGGVNSSIRIAGNGNNAVNTEYATLEFYNNDPSTAGPNVAASIKAVSSQSTGSGAHMVFGTSTGSEAEGTSATERMRIDSSGRVTMPYQPAFHAHGGGDETSIGIVVFPTALTNISNSYNTSNGRFTAPVDGTYKFSARIMKIAASGGSTVDFHFRKNGTQIADNFYDTSATAGQYSSGTINSIVTLNSGDYVEVYTSTTTSDNKVHAGHREFTGFLVG